MRLRGVKTLFGVLSGALACSGALEPGALTIVLDADPPEVTNATSVTLAGQVTRSPAEEGVVIVVSVTGAGTSLSDTADASNRFSFTVALTQNTQNQIQLSATDESGSTGTPLAVTVVHDGVGPSVTTFSPTHQADGVTSNAVTVTLGEKVHTMTGSGIGVARLGGSVAGAVTLSADSLSLTFTPTAPLATNAIHLVAVGGLRDAVGNLGSGATACFVTAGAGMTFDDPPDDLWVTQNPAPGLVPGDLTQIRVARGGGELRGILRFTSARSLDPSANNNLFAVIDFDTDEDGATGFISYKDSSFTGAPAPSGPSGTGVESGIWILPGSNSLTAQYTSPLDGPVTHTFTPDLCGTFVGFGVPETAIGTEDGTARMVLYSDAGFVDGQGFQGYADPAPESGFHGLALAAPPAAVVQTRPGPALDGRTASEALTRLLHRLPAWRRLR